MKKILVTSIAALFLATGTGTAHADNDAIADNHAKLADRIASECVDRLDQQCIKKERAIAACQLLFEYGYLQPGNEIGACYAKATNNRCDGSLDGSNVQVCMDWVCRKYNHEGEIKPGQAGAYNRCIKGEEPRARVRAR